MFDELEQLLNEGFNANRHMCVPKALSLRTDIQVYEDKYVVICEVPGLTKENISVNMENDVLQISAEIATADESVKYLLRERSFGKVTRSWRLPNVDNAKVSAALHDGVLTLTLPKLVEKARKTITIE